jgi:hypothetical protein
MHPMHRDPDIEDVEARIMRRRHEMNRVTHETGHRAMKALASPGALVGAAVVGFLAGGGIGRRPHLKAGRSGRRRSDPVSRTAAKTGVAGALMTGAMWLVRARFGSGAGLAKYLMARLPSRLQHSRRPEATSSWHTTRR